MNGDKIFDRCDELGLSWKALSLALKDENGVPRSHNYIQKFFREGVGGHEGFDERDSKTLSHILGLPLSVVSGPDTNPPNRNKLRDRAKFNKGRELHTFDSSTGTFKPVNPVKKLTQIKSKTSKSLTQKNLVLIQNKPSSDPRHNSLDDVYLPAQIYGAADLPVYGTEQDRSGGALIVNKAAVKAEQRPPHLMNSRNGYGIIVRGNDSAPRIENGETVYFNPDKAPADGDTCIFHSGVDCDSLAVIRKLQRFSEETWFVSRFLPDSEVIELKREEWPVCHVWAGSEPARY